MYVEPVLPLKLPPESSQSIYIYFYTCIYNQPNKFCNVRILIRIPFVYNLVVPFRINNLFVPIAIQFPFSIVYHPFSNPFPSLSVSLWNHVDKFERDCFHLLNQNEAIFEHTTFKANTIYRSLFEFYIQKTFIKFVKLYLCKFCV